MLHRSRAKVGRSDLESVDRIAWLWLAAPSAGEQETTLTGCSRGNVGTSRGECMMTAVAPSQDWTALAKCRGTDDDMFGEAIDQKRARLMCTGCPVRFECLAEALDNRIEWGVWGGLTERERRALLRARTDITSWKSVLRHAKAE